MEDLAARLVSLHRSLLEGVDPADHLVSQHAKGPPIDGESVTFVDDHFRSKILWRATEGISHAISRLLDLGEAKISELKVALAIEEHILWLQVSVDDPVDVEVLECEDDLSGVKACPVLRESNLVAKMEEELAAIQEVCDEVEALRGLEGEV